MHFLRFSMSLFPGGQLTLTSSVREVRLLCSFYDESLCSWIKIIINKFAVSNHTALILAVHALRSYL